MQIIKKSSELPENLKPLYVVFIVLSKSKSKVIDISKDSNGLTPVVFWGYRSSFACPQSSFHWYSMYLLMISSLTPVVLTKYQSDQSESVHQYTSFKNSNLLFKAFAVLHFTILTTSLTLIFGGMDAKMWTWSFSPLISNHSSSG